MKQKVSLGLACLACAASAFLGCQLGRGPAALAQAVAQAPGGIGGKDEMKPGAQEPPALTEYPYLPNRYGEAYIPSVAEWRALQYSALSSSTTRITEEFSRQQCTCFATPKGLALTLDLLPQPTWKHYAGGGKFSAPVSVVKPDLERAVAATLRSLRTFFSEVKDKDVSIQLFLRNEPIGSWTDGKLTLAAEKVEQ